MPRVERGESGTPSLTSRRLITASVSRAISRAPRPWRASGNYTGPESMRKIAIAVAAALCLSACATLGALVRPLRSEAAGDRPAELRLGGRLGLPDAATVRLWARVENPNTFGLTLSAIEGTLYLEESRAAAVEFPLGLPLEPRTEQVI